MSNNEKLKIEINFCFNTWLAKLIRLSLNREDLEIYAKEVYNSLIAEDVDITQAKNIKTFIENYSK